MHPMNRREAVKTTGVLLGGVLVTSAGMLTACSSEAPRTGSRVLSAADQSLIEEIADTLDKPAAMEVEDELVDLGLMVYVRDFLPLRERPPGS